MPGAALTPELNKNISGLQDYFALKQGDEFLSELFFRIEDYAKYVEASGKLALWKRSYKNYYLGAVENGRMKTGGEKNQFVLNYINHFANIIKHILNNVTSNRPNLRAKAENSDFKSLAQTKIGNMIVEYYLDEKKLENSLKKSAELSLIFDCAFQELLFDATKGDSVRPDENGNVIKQGDLDFYSCSPLDIVQDYRMSDPKDANWYITRRPVNRWELAAKFPAYENEILRSVSSMSSMRRMRFGHAIYEQESDLVFLYTFYHKKNNILPDGRFAQFVESENAVLIDGPLPYAEIPVYRIAPQEQHGTVWGNTVAYDLLPIQENVNMLASIISSNQAMFGVQSLLVPKGSGIEYSALQGGLKIVEYDAKPGVETKPSALQLTSTPPEVFNYLGTLVQQMEMISGVNSVVRGQPEASLKSGAALALMASQSIQFMSDFQQSYTQLLESVGTGIIRICKDMMKTPRLMSLAGKNNTQYLKEFTGDDLSEIERVTVEVSNPMTRTTAGKIQLAETLIQNGLISDPKQYLTLLDTGSIEPLTQGTESQLMLIIEENEQLSEGKQTPVLFTDNHAVHIPEHMTVLANLDARMNGNAVNAVLAHIQEHINQMKTLDPVIAGLTNQPMMQQPPQQSAAPLVSGQSPQAAAGQAVKGPNMPVNPLTHQSAVPGGI